MNAKDFAENYIMHDSLIDLVEVLNGGNTIGMHIDFAFWMQKGYNDSDPETGTLKVTFFDVSSYAIPENADWNAISILEMRAVEDGILFSLMNDMTDDYLEIRIRSNRIIVESVPNAK